MVSIYDPALWDSKTPANVLGGRNRAIKAKRDAQGRFMPNDIMEQALWSLDPEHGRPGGLAVQAKRRAIKAEQEICKMNTKDRITELKEKRDEFILNESVFEDENPSWLELAEAQAEAERRWDETDEGQELKALLDEKELE